MQTYQEWMTEHGTTITFPEQIDEPTQNKISTWFKYREVCDDVRFGDYFNRVLDEVAEQYRQYLRVEPGITTYDWLIQSYTEAQRKRKDSETTDKTSRVLHDEQNGKIVSFGKTSKTTGGEDVDGTTFYGKGITKNISDVLENDTEKEHTGSVDVLNGSVVRSGSEIETGTNGTQTVDASFTHHDGDTVITDDGYTVKDNKSLAKVNPQSITYGSEQSMPVADPIIDHTAQDGGTSASGMTLNWLSPSSQGQEYGRDVEHSEHKEHDHDVNVSRNNISNGTAEREKQFNDITDKTERTHGQSVDRFSEKAYTKNIGSEEITGGSDTVQKHASNSQEVENGGADYENGQVSSVTNGTDEGKRDLTTKDQYQQTGRQEAPADIMKRAIVFITGTNAWKWLKEELEVCFIGIYE